MTRAHARQRGFINPIVSYADPTDAQAAKGNAATVYVRGRLSGYIVRTASGRFQYVLTGGRGHGEEFDTVAAVKHSLESDD